MFGVNRRKIYFIVSYLIVLSVVYILARKPRKEGYEASSLSIPQGEIIKSFGTVLKDKPEVAEKALLFRAVRPSKRVKLPKSYPGNDFDGKEWKKYREYLSDIGNQEKCGSCWAWSTSLALGDRLSLLSDGKIKVQLSPAKMVMCTFKFEELTGKDIQQLWSDLSQRKKIEEELAKELKSQIACAGNDLYSACQELYTFGTTASECVPYKTDKYNIGASSDPSGIPDCWGVIGKDFDTCADGKTAARMFRADDIYTIGNREDDIMQEIFRYGPISAGYKVFSGFLNEYDGKSIYRGPKKDSSGNLMESLMGGHAIRVVGWGEEDGVKYWWIANSWSPAWGINGYFKMERMNPDCMLEENVVGMKPEFPGKSVWDPTLDIVQDIDRALRGFSAHKLDENTLYYVTALDKIKSGELKGDAITLINRENLPNSGNYDNFWVSSLLGMSPSVKGEEEQRNSGFFDLVFLLIAILGVAIILFSPL